MSLLAADIEAADAAAAAMLLMSSDTTFALNENIFLPVPNEEKIDSKTKVDRKQRNRNKPVKFLLNAPRGYGLIPNTDDKYNYPSRMLDPLSCHNFEMFDKVMKELCEPDVFLLFQYDGEKNPYGPDKREVTGVDAVVQMYIANMMQAIPDALLELVKDSVHVYKSNSSIHKNVDYFMKFNVIITQTRLAVMVEKENPALLIDSVQDNGSGNSTNSRRNSGTSNNGTYRNSRYTLNAEFDPNNPNNMNKKRAVGDISSDSSTADKNININNNIFNNNNSSSIYNVAYNSSNSDHSIDALTSELSSFTLEPIKGPVKTTIQSSKYILEINENGKIREIKHLFRVTNEKPAFLL